MDTERLLKKIEKQIDEMGYTSRSVSIVHFSEAQAELTQRYHAGYFDEEYYQERLTAFEFNPAAYLEGAQSVVIIAVPQPIVVVKFQQHEAEIPIVIPPTYDSRVNTVLKNQLDEIIEPEGYHCVPALLPLKYLAVRSGLVEYGRNNICYIRGKGSFYRLVAFVSDLPYVKDSWTSPRLLKRCTTCKACIVTCPSGAISKERFLLRAERCLTFHNEHAKEFPEYINRGWHHCLFGCLHCQKICPENKKAIKWIEERERFSEEETRMILSGISIEQVPVPLQQKLENLSLLEDYSLLSRNLSVLLT
jgi:epoxyqueuosine reductase